MNKKIIGLTAGLLLMLACGIGAPAAQPSQPSQPSVETSVVQTIQALTASAPIATEAAPSATETPQDNGQLTPDGNPVETAEVSFLIPNGVANDAISVMNTDVEYPYINPSNGDMPQHITVTLNLYTVTGTVTPQIILFKADEYANYGEITAAQVNALKSSPHVDGQPLPDGLNSTFTAQIHAVGFKNGHGVRYLTQVMQSFVPVNNQELFYYYQGLTDDGKYFVEATLPISAPYLAADSNPNSPLPADGIPFNTDDFQGYLNAVNQKLNSTETYSFNPYLDALDELIASMQVNGF